MATLRRADQPFMSLRDAMNQLFSEGFAPTFGPAMGGQGGPESLPLNVYEDGEAYHLHLLAPSAAPDTVEITAANGVLSIAVRQKPLSRENWRPVWQEFSPTEFRRQLRLPAEFDPNRIEAGYENGVLMITVPKAEHAKPKTIKVQVAG